MSILNDDRQYGTDDDRHEWLQEVNWEYRREDYEDRKDGDSA